MVICREEGLTVITRVLLSERGSQEDLGQIAAEGAIWLALEGGTSQRIQGASRSWEWKKQILLWSLQGKLSPADTLISA